MGNRKKPPIKPRRPANRIALNNDNESARPASIVGIGASAGGLEAFEQLLAALPENSGMAFVLVQHLAPQRESILSELLARSTRMPVVEVKEGVRVEPNRVYVIPPNSDMSIKDGALHLATRDRERALRLPIDLFFRSLADDQQNRAIGIILSGTASDGTLGLQAIKAAGGVTFAQDEQSAKYSAMPRSAVAAGNVDFVLPPSLIARELERISRHVHVFASDDAAEAESAPAGDQTLNKIFQLLRNVSRVDFNYYKQGTIKRRITRRMFLRKVDSLPSYLQLLRVNPGEVEALFEDILINVTGFFRDPEAFDVLRDDIFPNILKGRNSQSPLRIWVPGCSTGEEAYSLAIAMLEAMGDKPSNVQIQIFATDVSDHIIQKARAGIYPENIAMDISAERLRRFFQKADGGYQISKMIRDLCLFAKQDIAKDPPFSRLDMISCRNVMIYMSQVLQKRILPVFHYALNPGGILFLGTSETATSDGDLFVAIDKKQKIYQKKPGSLAMHVGVHEYHDASPRTPRAREAPPVDLQRIAGQLLLDRYAPASVVVDDNLNIHQFIGQTGRFLDPAPGDASLNLLRMVKTGLQLELRLAFPKVRKTGTVRREGLLVEHNGGLKTVNVEITSVRNMPGKERYYVVAFEDAGAIPRKDEKMPSAGKSPKKSAKGKLTPLETENANLREQLEATRGYLQSIIEEQRTTNEELRSANEEIQSSNEELQSINEELETAKEELQSTNEELTTVNEELQNRNDELSQLSNDLNNLLSSVNIPIVMVGNDMRIRRFTPVAQKMMNLIAGDVGRPITDIKSTLKLPDLRALSAKVIETLEIQETEVVDTIGRPYLMRLRPYRTMDNKIEGVVMIFLDFETRKNNKNSGKQP